MGGRGAVQTKPSRVSGYSNVATKTTLISEEDKAIMFDKYDGYLETGNSHYINKDLRRDRYDTMNAEDKLIVDVMDRNMKPLDQDIEVMRMVDTMYLNALGVNFGDFLDGRDGDENALNRIRNQLVGGVVKEKGFMSTTYNLDFKLFSEREVRLNMKVKKGTKALFSPSKKESELVLARGTDYKITSVRAENGKLVFDVETVN